MKFTIQELIQILGHLLSHKTETALPAHSPRASASDRISGSITLSVTSLGALGNPIHGEDFRTDLPAMPVEKAGLQNHSRTGSGETESKPWMEKAAADELFRSLRACFADPARPSAAYPLQTGTSQEARTHPEPSEPAVADTAVLFGAFHASVAANFHLLHSILAGIPCPHCGQPPLTDQAIS